MIYEKQSNIEAREAPGPNKYVLEYLIGKSSNYLFYLINLYRYGRVWQTSKPHYGNLRSTDIYIYNHINESTSTFLSDTFSLSIDSLYSLLNSNLKQATTLVCPKLTFSMLVFNTENKRDWKLYNSYGENMFKKWLSIDPYDRAFLSEAPLYAYIFKVFHSKHFNLEGISVFLNSSIKNKQIRDKFTSYLGTLIIFYKPEMINEYLEIFGGNISNTTFYHSFSNTNPYSFVISKLDVYGIGTQNCPNVQPEMLDYKHIFRK